METIYFKYLEFDNGYIKEKQKRAKIIKEYEDGSVLIEYEINGKTETRVLAYMEYQRIPFLMSF